MASQLPGQPGHTAEQVHQGLAGMFHCHVLDHEDSGMMGQYVLVEPGAVAGSPGGHHG